MQLERDFHELLSGRATSFNLVTQARAGTRSAIQSDWSARRGQTISAFHFPILFLERVFFNRVQAQLGHKRNWTDSDDLCTIFTATYTDDFYHAFAMLCTPKFQSGIPRQTLRPLPATRNCFGAVSLKWSR